MDSFAAWTLRRLSEEQETSRLSRTSNIIESLFSNMTRSMLSGIHVSPEEELKERISQYIEDMNETPTLFNI
jgi:hypothetical protein